MTNDDIEIENIYIELIIDVIYKRYGYDFKNYALSSLKRRIKDHITTHSISGYSELLDLILRDHLSFEKLFLEMTVNVTEMFRDPTFYRSFREIAIPILKTYPSLKIWHAGCSTGEEVYSMAILLEEEGILKNSRIYGTDINEHALNHAKEGIYSLNHIKEYTSNYLKSGGSREFSDYYHTKYDAAVINSELKKHIMFSHHNLVTDGSFSTFNLILCRNVMIYFDRNLQTRVLNLLDDSLCDFGIFCLGSKETLSCTVLQDKYKALNQSAKIYQKVGK